MENIPSIEASYLITFRDGDGTRLPLLKAVTTWLGESPQLEVIVVEQDVAPRLNSEELGRNVKKLFVYNNGPFNKSWGLNVAARNAAHEILVTGDADMFMSGGALGKALMVCRDHYDAVNPYANLIDLTPSETRTVIEDGVSSMAIQRQFLRDRRPQGEHICFCGGICVYHRGVYFELGGMDERFLGWGGEDDAMSTNLSRYTDRLAVQKDAVAYHLWHPRSNQRYFHPHYQDNANLANRYRLCDQKQLKQWRCDQSLVMGDPERYAAFR